MEKHKLVLRFSHFHLKIFHLCALLIMSSLYTQSIPPSKPLKNEEQIRLILHKIAQGIREQNILKVTDGFADEVESGGIRLNRKALSNKFKTSFEKSQEREMDSLFIKKKPVRSHLTTTWDFENDIDEIKFINDSTVLVKTWIYFTASEPDTSDTKWKFGKKHRNNFMFKKVKGEWLIKKEDRLLNVLQEYGDMR